MHILFITDNFPPEVNAPASRTYDHAKVWANRGHKITVVTCVPNFPTGKVFAGYKNRLWQREFMGGIEVIRVWSYISSNEGFSKRVLDFISFMLTSFIASMFVKKFDVVIGTSPQFFTVCSAYMVGLVRRKPFVFELRDLWPETIKVIGQIKSPTILKYLEKLEIYLYKKAALIISVTHSFKQNLIDRGINSNKIEVVTNGVDNRHFIGVQKKDPLLMSKLELKNKFIIGYIGTHGACHKLDIVLDAAKYFDSNYAFNKIFFIFVGEGSEKKMLKERSKNLKNIKFIDQTDKHHIRDFWSILDITVVHLQKDEMFKSVIPSKIFEAMAMEIPILIGVEGEAKKIILDNGVGLSFIPENSKDLIKKINYAASNIDEMEKIKLRCKLASSKYDREALAIKMISSLEGLRK